MERENNPSVPLAQRMAASKWIPIKSLSDDEYRAILTEKALSIEAEIAIIDEKIEELQKYRSNGLKTAPPSSSTAK